MTRAEILPVNHAAGKAARKGTNARMPKATIAPRSAVVKPASARRNRAVDMVGCGRVGAGWVQGGGLRGCSSRFASCSVMGQDEAAGNGQQDTARVPRSE